MNISTVAYCFHIKPRTLFKWYKDYISNYHEDKLTGRFAGTKVHKADVETGELIKEETVHIVKPENVGENMSIDEKMIDHKYCTILSNQTTGKIALLIDSMDPVLVKQGIEQLGEVTEKVNNISCDMSPMMKKISSECFENAAVIVDKFHLIKHILDALQSERLQIKNKLKLEAVPSAKNPNGWTDIEYLDKIKYLLMRRKETLDAEDKKTVEGILQKFPRLEKVYELCNEIRSWYDKSNVGKPMKQVRQALEEWKRRALTSQIHSFKKIVKMIDNHYDEILAYFKKGLTNAKAENLNSKIQRFLVHNRGTRNRDFFFFRVQVYFA